MVNIWLNDMRRIITENEALEIAHEYKLEYEVAICIHEMSIDPWDALCEWDLLNEIHFVGLSNYKSVFTEPEFLQILINTVVYAVSTTIFAVIIPLLIASIINNRIKGSELLLAED